MSPKASAVHVILKNSSDSSPRKTTLLITKLLKTKLVDAQRPRLARNAYAKCIDQRHPGTLKFLIKSQPQPHNSERSSAEGSDGH